MTSNLIQEKIAALQTLDTPALRRLWGEAFGGPPPKPMRRDLLLRAIAYHVQEQAQGGLRPATSLRLARAAQDLSSERRPAAGPLTIKAGTRLLREWQGLIHEVIVLEEGVRYRGQTWRSLSAVAREITGVRWSGPLFFGLKGHRR
jgi:Protein of unknown function (DUF2924)